VRNVVDRQRQQPVNRVQQTRPGSPKRLDVARALARAPPPQNTTPLYADCGVTSSSGEGKGAGDVLGLESPSYGKEKGA